MAADNKSDTRGAPSLLDRTLRSMRVAWRDLTDRDVSRPRDPDLADELDRERLAERMRECLIARGGEVSARARAVELGRFYRGLSEGGRRQFLALLAGEFDRDRSHIDAIAGRLLAGSDERHAAEEALRDALEAPRVKLLRQFNALPDGTKFLVDLRADLLRFVREDSSLAGLERDLKRLLAGWFDIGFLDLRRITWDSPASLLEKLSRYEAVHEVRDWGDLKNRLDSDRRCFAFFHPRMPDEPIIFVEVALVSGLADSVQALLDERAPLGDSGKADNAIFYSISNAQRGLDGIGFGGFLIKRVVDELSREFPALKSFATLSPIPGFRRWFARQDPTSGFTTRADRKALQQAAKTERLDEALAVENWHGQPKLAEALTVPVTRAVSRYLIAAKRPDGAALDPVAHFHLSNGARVERINWLADRSPRGLERSFGAMVNYAYDLNEIEANHEAYTADGQIAASSSVLALAREVR
jgi:malonyl-CoA decarboxylase